MVSGKSEMHRIQGSNLEQPQQEGRARRVLRAEAALGHFYPHTLQKVLLGLRCGEDKHKVISFQPKFGWLHPRPPLLCQAERATVTRHVSPRNPELHLAFCSFPSLPGAGLFIQSGPDLLNSPSSMLSDAPSLTGKRSSCDFF